MEEVINQKSYNLFKMWGSWVGGIVGILLIFLSPIFWIGYFILEEISISLVQGESAFFGQTIAFVLNFIIFGLIGWGIHSLIRRLKK